MKQIFDDIRKEIDIHSDEDCFIPDDMLVIPSSWMLKKLDEAEAKWEADCCEWRLCDEEANVYDTSCRNPHILIEGTPKENNYEYCPYCGKPIKIIEVE